MTFLWNHTTQETAFVQKSKVAKCTPDQTHTHGKIVGLG
jgi:hypothetical protein